MRRHAEGFSDGEGSRTVGVDAQVGDRLGDHRSCDPSALGELLQHGDHQVGAVDLEVRAQRVPRVGAPEAVGPERRVGAVHEPRHLVGHAAHVVGDGHDRIGPVAECLRDDSGARLGLGVQAVPPLDFEGVSAQVAPRGDGKEVGGDAVLGQDPLCVHGDGPHRPRETQ